LNLSQAYSNSSIDVVVFHKLPQDSAFSRPTCAGCRYTPWNSTPATPSAVIEVRRAPHYVPFCITARNMQLDPTRDALQSDFTFGIGAPSICNTCQSRVPTNDFKIRRGASVWQVSKRFMARCHKPSLSPHGQAQLGCLFCPAESSTFKSRNELWAHLQTHSTLAFESDVEIVEGTMV